MTKSINRAGSALRGPSQPTTSLPNCLPRGVSRLCATMLVLSGALSTAWAHPTAAGSKQRPQSAATAPAVEAAADGLVGYASYYARRFAGRIMADGTPMLPDSDNAASPTLPLGSKALVTNLRNGRTAVVTIRDRGPFVKGRILDVSPSTARALGMLSAGVVKVSVLPMDELSPQEKIEAVIAAAEGDGAGDAGLAEE